MSALSFNWTNVTSRNAFNLDLFPVGGEKESKYDERTLFWGLPAETWLVCQPLASERRIYAFYFYVFFLPLPLTFGNYNQVHEILH